MGSCLVEVHHIGIEDALELLLVDYQHMVKAFLSYASHEAFAEAIGSGCMIRCCENLNPTCGRHSSKAGPKCAVVIMDQIFRCLPIGSRFPEVLGHPGIGRRSSDADMDHPSRLEEGEEESKERSKEQIDDLQEVARPDLSGVSVQKGRPFLSSWLRCANFSHVLLDRALADAKAQFPTSCATRYTSPSEVALDHTLLHSWFL